MPDRYIPACAGEARVKTAPASIYPVHPRVCGGSVHRMPSPLASRGTSPRVRGKR